MWKKNEDRVVNQEKLEEFVLPKLYKKLKDTTDDELEEILSLDDEEFEKVIRKYLDLGESIELTEAEFSSILTTLFKAYQERKETPIPPTESKEARAEASSRKRDSVLPAYVDLDKATEQMKKNNKELREKIANLPISKGNKNLVLKHMTELEANITALEVRNSKNKLSEEEKSVLNSGRALLGQFKSYISSEETAKTLENPKVFGEFVKMLKSAAKLSKDPKNPSADEVQQLIDATKKDQKSFTPGQDAAWKALKTAALVFAFIVGLAATFAAVAAITYFTGGLGLPFLAPLVPMIASLGSSILAFGTTAAATTATFATGSAATAAAFATGSAATVAATAAPIATAAAAPIVTAAAAHPIIAGAALGAGAVVGTAVMAKGATSAVTNAIAKRDETKTTIDEKMGQSGGLKETLNSYRDAAKKVNDNESKTADEKKESGRSWFRAPGGSSS